MSDIPPKKYRIKCPSCPQVLLVPPTSAGKRANCPKCKQAFEIPVLPTQIPNASKTDVGNTPKPKVQAATPSANLPSKRNMLLLFGVVSLVMLIAVVVAAVKGVEYVLLLLLAIAAAIGMFAVFRYLQWDAKRHMERQRAARERLRARLFQLAEVLLADPNDLAAMAEIERIVEANRGHSDAAYEFSLKLVEKTGGSAATKKHALNVGRIHYSRFRDHRAPTIYDEKAIQNDIQARC